MKLPEDIPSQSSRNFCNYSFKTYRTQVDFTQKSISSQGAISPFIFTFENNGQTLDSMNPFLSLPIFTGSLNEAKERNLLGYLIAAFYNIVFKAEDLFSSLIQHYLLHK